MENTEVLTAAGADAKLSLTVANFGPIEQAEVALRPFTVFVGPSNTGKSYLAILLYVLHRCFGRNRDLRSSRFDRVFQRALSRKPLGIIREKIFRDWIRNLRAQNSIPRMPQMLTDYVKTILQEAQGLNSELEDELERCFVLDDLHELCRIPSDGKSTSLTLRTERSSEAISFAYDFRVGVDSSQLRCNIDDVLSRLLPMRESLLSLAEIAELEESLPTTFWFSLLIDKIQREMFSVVPKAYYLPADRTGVMHSHTVVLRSLVRDATAGSRRKSEEVPILSGVLADFLENLITIGGADQRSRRNKDSVGLEKHIEREILKGAVQLDKSESKFPAFGYRPNGWSADLPLSRASSMVSELTPLVLYAQYLIEPGDLVIIEEPEAHLHPAMQAEMTRALARSVRKGLRVVITTHSEWVLESLGNLVQLSALPQEGRSGFPGEDCALSPDQVGIWLFDQEREQGGVTLKEVELDAESGLYSTGFDDVSEALYNDNARIFNRRQEFQGK